MGNESSQNRFENDTENEKENHCQLRQCRGKADGERRKRGERRQRVKGNSKPPTWEQLKATNLKLWKTNGEKFIEIYHQTREIKELKRKLRQTRHNLEQRNKTIRDLRDLKSGNSLDESFFGNLFEE
tara:strand:- start:89 stop:469 length:381 start_codon:yes stop_codon:yes gene_type:complete